MNIESIINSLNNNQYIDSNPSYNNLCNLFTYNNNINSIQYNVNYVFDNIDKINIMSLDSNNFYIIVDFHKNLSDIINLIRSNYKIALVINYDTEIYNIENVSLPILFCIYTKIQFKIYFNNKEKFIDEYINGNIYIIYNSYTFSIDLINKLLIEYKINKSISNNRGMTFQNGILINDLDLD
jgi:hypothetical protein